MANIVGLVGIGVSGVALLFAIVALASNRWETIKHEDITGEIRVGLWKICTEIEGLTGPTCEDFELVDHSQALCEDIIFAIACRAIIVLAISMTTGAIVCALLVMFVIKEQQILLFVAGGLNLVSGIFLMIAMALYVEKIRLLNYGILFEGAYSNLGYGFFLDMAAWLAAWVAGGLFIAAKFLTKNMVNTTQVNSS